ncbi:MAG: site-specific integrase, partial [Burkholderiales bacterium]|nr:site-specific integrase [Burkholderiales bacterium]
MNITPTDQVVFFESHVQIDGLKLHQPALFIRTASAITLFEEPTYFIHANYVQNGRTPSKHTWFAAGYALKSWFEFLQAINRGWRNAQRQDRIDYRDTYACAISPRTGQAYDAGTIRNRMTIIREFYQFAFLQGWYSGDIASGEFDIELQFSSATSDPLAHIHRQAAKTTDRDLPKKIYGNRIHPFQTHDLRKLLNQLGPRASESQNDFRPARDRLMADLGWVVGLRLDEIQQLTTLQFLALHVDPFQPLIDQMLIIRRGKGAKPRNVAIPNWLVQDIQHYINQERVEALRKGKISSKSATISLFLSAKDANISGRPLKHRRIQQII